MRKEGKKEAVHARVRVCVCGLRGSAMKSWAEMANLKSVKNVWMHLRASRDKKGSRGLARAPPRPPNPQAQPSLQGMPQICAPWLSPRRRPSSAGRFNMLCVPAPPAPLHLRPALSQSGTPAPRFKEPAKGTFQAGAMSPG